MLLITNSKKMVKSVHERKHPGPTPTNTQNQSVSLPSIVIAHLEFL